MRKVNKETLQENIEKLKRVNDDPWLNLSKQDEFQLEAYELLINCMEKLSDAEELLAGVHYEIDNENASLSKSLENEICDFLWGKKSSQLIE